MDGIAEGYLSSVGGSWILPTKTRVQYDEGCSKSSDSVSSGLKSQDLGRIMGVSVRTEDTQPRTSLTSIHEGHCACVPGVCRLHTSCFSSRGTCLAIGVCTTRRREDQAPLDSPAGVHTGWRKIPEAKRSQDL